MTGPAAWSRAHLAARLLSINPAGLGGVWIRARSGEVRDRYLNAIAHSTDRPITHIHPNIDNDALLGGLDVATTLATGKPSYHDGLLRPQTLLKLAMAERAQPDLSAKLCLALDRVDGLGLIALDEGIDDEALPQNLADRLAFHVSLEDLRASDCASPPSARGKSMQSVSVAAQDIAALTLLTAKLGITSLRAPLFALQAARAHAALNDRSEVSQDDLRIAAELVLAPRAITLPTEPEENDPQQQPDEAPDTDGAQNDQDQTRAPDDILLDAVKAILPPELLAQLSSSQPNRNASGTAMGARKTGNRRGRPLAARKGKPRSDARIDLIATLRSAAPWQTIRRRTAPAPRPVHIRAEDIHLKRYQSRSDRLITLAVDASGSSAMNRLAEAKGAIELLLAEAYAMRDHVALVAFRGETAELLLPPTRSLVQAKRRLAALPGGGGTPLAAGLRSALTISVSERRKGLTATIALIADGRTNIALDGAADRPQALSDALTISRQIAALGITSAVIDISKRPEPQLREIAGAMNAAYVPMPFADAARMSSAVNTTLTST